jgi:hypothetical protein
MRSAGVHVIRSWEVVREIERNPPRLKLFEE